MYTLNAAGVEQKHTAAALPEPIYREMNQKFRSKPGTLRLYKSQVMKPRTNVTYQCVKMLKDLNFLATAAAIVTAAQLHTE